jgi:hypothetical protein
MDELLPDQGDPEKRIAGLEHQLARQHSRTNLPPASPDDASSSRRYVASTSRVQAWYTVWWCVLLAAALALIFTGRVLIAWLGPATFWVAVILAAGMYFLLGLLGGFRWWGMYRKVPFCVTSEALTVDRRPGNVFSFTDAKLGLWTPGSTTPWSGTALHLRCGKHRFVLGGRDHRLGSATPLEAPPTGRVDGWLRAPDFEEVLTAVGRRSGLDVRAPAPGEPIRCLLFPRGNPQPSLAIDVGEDAVWVIDPNTGERRASASLAQVTATPADYVYYRKDGSTTPVLIVGVPGTRTLTLGCPTTRMAWNSLFSWCDKVPKAKQPEFVVSDADWLVLVEKFGLAPYLNESKWEKSSEWYERPWRRKS